MKVVASAFAAVDCVMTSGAVKRRVRTYRMPLSALAGAVLLAWLVASIGTSRLVELWVTARPLLPLLVALAGLRYGLQASGWRLAMPVADRPGWRPALAAVIAGEAAGYAAWGTVAREPVKLLFVRQHVTPRVAFAGAAIERFASLTASTALVFSAAVIAATHLAPYAIAWAALVPIASVVLARRRRPAQPGKRHVPADGRQGILYRIIRSTRERVIDMWNHRRPVLGGIFALALAQELINLAEAYIVLTWLGAAPSIATIIVFEGAGRFLNALGQFVPGRVGVSEGINALVASMLSVAPAFGVGLALMRRARSIIWGVVGLGLVVYRGVRPDAMQPGRLNPVGRRATPPAYPVPGDGMRRTDPVGGL